MVEGMVALVATLAALVGTGLLVQSALKERRPHLVAWSVALGGLSLSLAAMAVGALAGFGPVLFRAMEIFGALLGPVCLAIGLIELISHYVQVRFATRLIGVSYSLVAVVILSLDPLNANVELGKSIPDPGDVYEWLPGGLITGGHVMVILALIVGAVLTAVRANNENPRSRGAAARGGAQELLLPAALATGAGVLNVGAIGYLPGALKVIGLAAAAGLVWYAASRTLAADDEEEAEDDVAFDPSGRSHRARPEPHDNGRMRPEPQRQRPPQQPHVPPQAQGPAPIVGDDWFAPPAPPQAQTGGPYGQIVVYTLLDGREQAFDRMINDLVRQATQVEPGILIFTCHEVEGAPTQRISYQLFSDRGAFAEHQSQQHVRRFQAESRTHVLATNVIDLRLTGGNLPAFR